MGQTLSNNQFGSPVDTVDSKPGDMYESSSLDGGYYVGGKPSKEDVYDMSHAQRGYFLIINNKDFQASTGMAERSGTDVDADALKQLFASFGFKVVREDNVKVTDMMKMIKQASTIDHSGMDCFGLTILSHGDEGIIYGTDDFIPIDKLLLPIKNCKSLAGKPKLFIIQACRGSQLDGGHMISSDGGGDTARIPIEADCLYAFSTVPGYYSWRNSIRGSWFVQSIVNVFNSEKRPTDLLRMMTRVNRMVACEFESNSSSMAMNHKKQVPYIASTLTRDLYLMPRSK